MNVQSSSQIEHPGKAASTSKLAIVGSVEIVPEHRDQLIPLLMAHKARCLKDEPGTLQFEVMAPQGDDTKLLLCEVYQSDAAFEVHLHGQSIAQFRRETAGMIAKLNVTKCALMG